MKPSLFTLSALLLTPLAALYAADAPIPAAKSTIDRHALVTRHNITWNEVAGRLPLGNGEFCFGADGSGLQTFAGNSMSHWGWHSFPLPEGWTPDRVPSTGHLPEGPQYRRRQFSCRHGCHPYLDVRQSSHHESRTSAPDASGWARLDAQRHHWPETNPRSVDGRADLALSDRWPGGERRDLRASEPRLGGGSNRVAAGGQRRTGGGFGFRLSVIDRIRPGWATSPGPAVMPRSRSCQGERRIDFTRRVDAVTYHAALAVGHGLFHPRTETCFSREEARHQACRIRGR